MISARQVQGAMEPQYRSASVSAIRPLASGMLNHVYRAQLSDPPCDIVVRERHFTDPEYGQYFAAERLAYPLLCRDRPRVPAFLGADESGTLSGNPLAVFGFIDGTRLDDLLENRPSSRLLRALAIAIGHVHEVAAPGYGTLSATTHGPEETGAFWQSLFEAEAATLARLYPASAENLRSCIPEWLARLREAPPGLVAPALVHGDFHARNIIIDSTGEPNLIDWEAARFRSPGYDLVQILDLNLIRHKGAGAEFLSHYLATRRISASPDEAMKIIDVFKRFWRIRMGGFMCLNDVPGCSYFGFQADYRRYLQEGGFLEF